MAITGCNYGSHAFRFAGGLGDGQHVHECTECGASYIRPGTGPCVECAERPVTEACPGCCRCCDGRGADANCQGPCWDCSGTGHTHPIEEATDGR